VSIALKSSVSPFFYGEKMDNTELLEQIQKIVDGKKQQEKLKVVDVLEKIKNGKAGLRPNTIRNYEYILGKMVKIYEYYPVEVGQFNEFLSKCSVTVNDSSLMQFYRTIKSISHYMKKTYGWEDVSDRINKPSVERKKRRYLSDTELSGLAGACKDVMDTTLIMALLDSTCRINDLAGLKVDSLGISSFSVKHGKTGQLKYRCDSRIIEMMKSISVEGIIFPKQDRAGNVIKPVEFSTPCALGNRVRAVMVRSGMKGEKLGPHTLRHTAASLVARKTMSALAVKSLLQHDDIHTSERYMHDVDDNIQQQISPLQLSGMDMNGKSVQGVLGQSEVLKIESPERAGIKELIAGLMPDIPEGISIRPKLDSKDLRIIKNAMLEYMSSRGETGSASECVVLIRRILRRV